MKNCILCLGQLLRGRAWYGLSRIILAGWLLSMPGQSSRHYTLTFHHGAVWDTKLVYYRVEKIFSINYSHKSLLKVTDQIGRAYHLDSVVYEMPIDTAAINSLGDGATTTAIRLDRLVAVLSNAQVFFELRGNALYVSRAPGH